MKLKKIIMLALVFCNFGVIQNMAAQAENNVPKVITQWEKFWNTYDLSQLDKLFVSDDSVTYFSSERPGLIKGYAALRKHYKGFGFVEGGAKKSTKLWLQDITTIYSADRSSVVIAADWYFEKNKDGVKNIGKGPVTFVCIKTADGTYKIQHSHFANY